MRTVLDVTMVLLSDTIFNSGYSVPGGEDIAVYVDAQGYPYLKGSTFKGLLRESAENLIAWGEPTTSDINLLFGADGWSSTDDEERLMLTSFILEDRPNDPEDCFDLRTFTSVTDGVVTKGGLRTASCVRANLRFKGQIICADKDVPFLIKALKGIHRLGTMRNRGFGSVKITCQERSQATEVIDRTESACIKYRLYLSLPVQITDLQHSHNNDVETHPYITGSAVRGMVMGRLAKKYPSWFKDNKLSLLSDKVRFLDAAALPRKGENDALAVIPSPRGFFEDAKQSEVKLSLVEDFDFEARKRVRLGVFCQLKGDTVRYWSPETDSTIRIRRADGDSKLQVFQNGYLCAGQTMEGYILLDDPSLAPKIKECFEQSVWLGADRYAGFGKCEATCYDTKKPSWAINYGLDKTKPVADTVYMLLVSPTAAIDSSGAPCAIDSRFMSDLLKTDVTVVDCATSVAEFKSYNRTWQCYSPSVKMYDRGGLFKLTFNNPPPHDLLDTIEWSGVGMRRAEGFGQVLFLDRHWLENITKKVSAELNDDIDDDITQAVTLRRNRIRWISEQAQSNPVPLNLTGELQMLCEQAVSKGGDLTDINAYIEKNSVIRGAAVRDKYRSIIALTERVLFSDEPLPINDKDSMVEKLQLLCMLFNHMRKKGGK